MVKNIHGLEAKNWDENFENFRLQFYGSFHTNNQNTTPSDSEKMFPKIKPSELWNAIAEMKPNTANGHDEIPLQLIKDSWIFIKDYFCCVCNTLLKFGIHPIRWKLTKTIIIPKEDKPNYSISNAYRPIALICQFSRILEATISKRLFFIAESNNLFPDEHHGFRAGRRTTDGLVILKNSIKHGWNNSEITSTLSLDLSGAYDNVIVSILIQKMRALNIPEYLVSWTESLLTDRSTFLYANDKVSPIYQLSKGLPQGSPIAPILFLFFNSDLINILRKISKVCGYADDIFLSTTSRSVETNIETLEKAAAVAIEWANKNEQEFSEEKSNLIHFSKNRIDAIMQVGTKTIYPQLDIRLLGVIFDSKLSWNPHVSSIVKRCKSKLYLLK